MKLLHTSDWHLGRSFNGHSLETDHKHILDQVLNAVRFHKPDALIVAGDIFDRTSPPEYAIGQCGDFIRTLLSTTDTALIMIAGNHDSAQRIGIMDAAADKSRALIRGPLSAIETPIVLNDEHGPVAITALPFAYEYAARECFNDVTISSASEVMAKQVEAARAKVPEGARWVITAHAFVAGAATSDSEKSLGRIAGGIQTVSSKVFDGAHYVALGHLHRSQKAGAEHIRYSGSPLPFGFDEAGAKKSMTLVNMDASGGVTLTVLPFSLLREVEVKIGKFEDLMVAAEPSDNFIKIILTDDDRKIDPMKQIREFYPNAGPLSYKRDEAVMAGLKSPSGKATKKEPREMISDFLVMTRGSETSASELSVMQDYLPEAKPVEIIPQGTPLSEKSTEVVVEETTL